MQDASRPGAALPVSTLVLLAAVVGGAVWYSQPLRSFRPAQRPALKRDVASIEDVDARLWQDPFLAVQEHQEAREQEHDSPVHSLKAGFLAEDLKRRVSAGRSVLLLPAFVDGGNYAEDIETRLRTRYAMVTALVMEGFQPEDRGHLGVLQGAICECGRLVSSGAVLPDRKPVQFKVPFEWYTPDPLARRVGSTRQNILLLWIDESALGGKPLTNLRWLLEHIIAKVEPGLDPKGELADPFKVKMIGPGSSNKLLEIMRDRWVEPTPEVVACSLTHSKADFLWKVSLFLWGVPFDTAGEVSPPHRRLGTIEIFNCRATAPEALLLERCKDREAKVHIRARDVRDWLEDRGVLYRRTICGDDALVWAMTHELLLRGVDLTDPDTDIALVGELDTFYSRSLPMALESVVVHVQDLCGVFDEDGPTRSPLSVLRGRRVRKTLPGMIRKVVRGRAPANPDFRPISERFHLVSYMRGLDGSTPSAKDQPANTGDGPTDGKKEEWQHPVGASQLDYIRRQAQALRRLDRRRELRAIGVVGTDLYDKQLILQALRSEFPGILFFTTDLDSRLLHSSQYHWSRNLLIASAFGLELDAKLQGRAPPFRDSYQTATFLAARAALFDGNGDSRLDPERLESGLQPRVFEIARGGAYDITPREYASDLHAAPSEAQENLGFLPWIVLSALVLFLVTSGAVARIRELFCDLEERTWRCALVAASAAGLLAIAVFPLVFRAAWTPPSDGGEPLVFAEGISVWPTESVRVLVFLVSVLGIVFGAAALERNKRCLRQTLGLTPPKKGEALGFRGSLEQSQWIPCRTRDDAQREGDATRPEPVDAGEEWKRYLLNGRLLPSFGRVTVMVLAYFTLGGMLFAIWGTPHNPLRGAQAMILDRLALILSVVSLAALIFFVVDATRECGIFIEALSKRTSRWPKGVRKRLGEKLDLREEDLAEWLDIQLITSRTRVVGNLILVPFVAILLMVLSRNHYFDDWEWPVSLIAIFSIQAVFPLAAAVRMRRAAERARGAVLSRLELRLTHRLGLISQKGQAECRQLEGLQRTIREVREGAFSPWFQSPAVRAVLMPFGGIGALAVLDILAKGGI